MKLRHWSQIALKSLCTRIQLMKRGTVTARLLADYPIDNNYRRCVVQVTPNDDAKFGYQTPIYRDPIDNNPRFDTELIIEWLLDNGKRFTKYRITPDDVTECHDFPIEDISKPREKWGAVYEFTYICHGRPLQPKKGDTQT